MHNIIVDYICAGMKETLALDNQVCFPVYTLAREIIGKYRPFLDELDITYPQYLALMVLWEKGVQTVNQIGDNLFLDSGTLTPLLKRMEQKGLLTRTRKQSDERVVEIALTQKGELLKEQAALVPQKVTEAMGVSSQELLELKQIVAKILNIAKNSDVNS